MLITWLVVAILLAVIFASISIVGALNRIADATERTAAAVSSPRDESSR
ncbi:MAG TPA: hypothetical protein VGP24_16175 [Glaciihabitans sp.]|nr:hypothetical protein [Glaciihabitans sp.]